MVQSRWMSNGSFFLSWLPVRRGVVFIFQFAKENPHFVVELLEGAFLLVGFGFVGFGGRIDGLGHSSKVVDNARLLQLKYQPLQILRSRYLLWWNTPLRRRIEKKEAFFNLRCFRSGRLFGSSVWYFQDHPKPSMKIFHCLDIVLCQRIIQQSKVTLASERIVPKLSSILLTLRSRRLL